LLCGVFVKPQECRVEARLHSYVGELQLTSCPLVSLLLLLLDLHYL